MIAMNDFGGNVECNTDKADCIMDGEEERRAFLIQDTGGLTLTLR